jgi:recombination protein RecA
MSKKDNKAPPPEPPKETKAEAKEEPKETPKKKAPEKDEAPKKGQSIASVARALLKKHAGGLETVKPSFTTMAHIPSGSIVLNNLMGGSPASDGKGAVCPGYPRRRIIELYGAESCGKTTLAISAVVQCQKAGGVAAFLDFEHSLHDGYAKACGMSFAEEKLLYLKPDTLEQGMTAIYLLIRAGVDLIVVDSVASMVPKDELEKDAGDAERIGSVAGPLTRNLKKLVIWLAKYPDPEKNPKKGTAVIFINQTRAKISTGGGGYGASDEDQTPGGKALKFYSSLRLRMTRIMSKVIKKKDALTGKDISLPYGNVTKVKIVKTKIDLKQGQEGVIFIRFGQGLDDTYSIIENGIRFKQIKKEAAGWLIYDGQRYHGQETFQKVLTENPKLLAELQAKVTAAMFSTATAVNPAEQQSEDDALIAEIESDLGDDAAFDSDDEVPGSEDIDGGTGES